MVVEDLIPFFSWLPGAALALLVIGAVLTAFGILFGYLIASFRHGPTEGFYVVSRVFFQAIPDLFSTSPRRVWAIAKLAMRETIRRKVLIVAFAIFGIVILFGGWFLESDAEHPERVYIGFLGWGTQLLVIMLGLMISSFSLPADIKNKTIYTVTTKPVRATEIVLGRILGFTLVGTLLLTTIWLVSYLFIMRGLNHSHELSEDDIQVVTDGQSASGGRVSANALREGFTTLDARHRHQVEFFPKEGEGDDDEGDDKDKANDPEENESEENESGEHTHADGTTHSHDGEIRAKKSRGHTHAVKMNEDGTYSVGGSEGNLLARVPIYATSLNYISREGTMVPEEARMYNVGASWDYRSYIDGGSKSKARAVFFFDGIKESRFEGNKLPLNVQVEVFRSHKGDIENPITASLFIKSQQKNDQQDYVYETPKAVKTFQTEEYEIQTIMIPRKIMAVRTDFMTDPPTTDKNPVEYDIFDDIAQNGSLTVFLKCDNEKQYIGVAKKDVFFRPANKSFFQNFLKAYLGIWLQMLVVVSLGVMFSTFLSSIVALLATLSALIIGLNSKFLHDIATNRVEGGGPIESFYRIVTQQNMMNPLEDGAMSSIVKSLDMAIIYVVDSLASIMPDYGKINFFDFLAEGYNIEWQRLLIGVVLTLTFSFVSTIIGYFVLKSREIAA